MIAGCIGLSSLLWTTAADAAPILVYQAALDGAHASTNSTATGAASAADLLSGLAAGTAYVDIPDASFGTGEVRGHLTAVPEPATPWRSSDRA